MKFLFVGIVVLFGSMALAQDLNFSEYRKFLMNGSKTSGNKMVIQTTCTTAAGHTYRIGDSGYDACLAAIKSQHQVKDSANKKEVSTNEAGATTTIHIGN